MIFYKEETKKNTYKFIVINNVPSSHRYKYIFCTYTCHQKVCIFLVISYNDNIEELYPKT